MDSSLKHTQLAVALRATAFREDRPAELVTITNLTFNGCDVAAETAFDLGERLRLNLPGQGWIVARVQWVGHHFATVIFDIRCDV